MTNDLSEAALEQMMEQFYLYERAIDVWLRTSRQDDKAMMDGLRGAYETAVEEWYSLQYCPTDVRRECGYWSSKPI